LVASPSSGPVNQSCRKCLKEIETPMFFGNGCSHRNRAEHVAQAADAKEDEETKSDAEQSVEKRLNSDAVDDVN